MDKLKEISFVSIAGYILFIVSEIMALSRLKSNGVVEFLSRRIRWLGGKKIRIEVGIQSASSSEIEENNSLLDEVDVAFD